MFSENWSKPRDLGLFELISAEWSHAAKVKTVTDEA